MSLDNYEKIMLGLAIAFAILIGALAVALFYVSADSVESEVYKVECSVGGKC